MYYKKEIGNNGEKIAREYLEKSNYKIIDTNFYSKSGEIDIIANDIQNDEIVFIEVKTRTNTTYGNPIDAINKQKMNHMYQTAKYYIKINKLEQRYIRFDAIEVYIIDKKTNIHHIQNII